MNHRHLVAAIALGLMGSAAAEASPPSDWRWTLEGGAVSELDTSLDSGGEFGVDRFVVDLSAARRYASGTRVGVSFSYGQSRYDFSNAVQLGSSDPWGRIQQASLSASVFYSRRRCRPRHAPALGAARAAGADRHQVRLRHRLRHRRLRLLHRACRRRGGARLHPAGLRRQRGPGDRHHRGAVGGQRPPAAAGLGGAGRAPVRLLPAGHHHERRGAAGRESRPTTPTSTPPSPTSAAAAPSTGCAGASTWPPRSSGGEPS
jgi:hypothetical protein